MSVKYDLYYSKENEYGFGSNSCTLPNGETLTYTEMIRTGESPITFRYEDLKFVATIDPKGCKFARKEIGHKPVFFESESMEYLF